MATEDKVSESSEEKIGMPERKGTRKRVNPLARFFKVWATPLSILIAAATLLWSVYQFTAQQQSASQQAVQQQQLTRQQEAASAQMQATQEAASAAQALDQQRQTTLDTYLDDISNLLLVYHLGAPDSTNEVRALAQARTYAAVRNLDGARKGTLVRFLVQAGLISGSQPIISVFNADLRGAIFTNADLSGANLERAYLSVSAVSHPGPLCFRGPHQVLPPFGGGVNPPGADLSGADLSGADLHGAQVTTEQLAKAASLKGATMPDGSTHP